eukprot:3858724-Prymnesium_polylepis.1
MPRTPATAPVRPTSSKQLSLAKPVAGCRGKGESTAGTMSRAERASAAPRLITLDDRDGPMSLHYYPPGGDEARGLVVLAPGSRGGMGPGQVACGKGTTIGKFDPSIRCVYPLLAQRLASLGFAIAHLNWRLCPTRKGAPPGTLKSPTSLMLGAAD